MSGIHTNIEQLEEIIGYSFSDKQLIKRALTHTSYANEQKINKNGHYERLEFLGDAVLELVTSEYLYLNYPDMKEGVMTKFRASIVCEESLAEASYEIMLCDKIFLGRGEVMTGGRRRDSILADIMEAIIGALYLEGGIQAAKAFVHKFILNDIDEKKLFYDAKSSLQEITQQKKLGPVQYVLLGEKGPEHEKVFECAVLIDSKQMGTGSGRNKKEAEQKAAKQALLSLK